MLEPSTPTSAACCRKSAIASPNFRELRSNVMKMCNRETGRLFLREQLSREHEVAFSEHIGSCECCRSWLEEDSGDDRTWNLARELDATTSLSSTQSDGTKSESSLEQVAEQVRLHLTPSDDPSMMGRLGPYEIIGVIGRGGMGIVLKAYERSLDRNVALKMLDPAIAMTGAARKRFAREANAMASVSHPCVVPIFAVDEHRGLPYFAMEYVVGETLDRRIRRDGPLNAESAVRIALQISEALAAAHSQGVVHRDIKPANILLDHGTDRVRVADFGLARVASESSFTRTGMVAGTPQYMSPEQVRGEPCDARSDLFSLGTVLCRDDLWLSTFSCAESVYGVMQCIVHMINPEPSAKE
ncbi:MAG: serine/threonine-protein kinase [Pirellulaceae bacterium]